MWTLFPKAFGERERIQPTLFLTPSEKENEFEKYKAWVQEKIEEIDRDSKNNSCNMSIEDERKIDCTFNVWFFFK